MKYRKKPIVIEAVRVTELLAAAARDWPALPDWIRAAYERGEILFVARTVEIVTLEGRMAGCEFDWIIRGVRGELYPCKPDIFEATYEAVDGPAAKKDGGEC